MIAEVCVGAAWPFLLAAAVLRLRPVAGPVRGPARERPLTPVGIGLLRGGGRGAAQTALVELHLAGSVEGAWAGMVRRDDTRPPPPGASGLARAQYSVLFGKLHPSRLQRIGRVERALAAEARAVERAGLLLSGRRVAAVRILLLPVLCAAPVAAVAGRLTAPWLLLALLADGAALALGALPRRTRGARHSWRGCGANTPESGGRPCVNRTNCC